MQWIKKNLVFVIGGVVALALLVLAIFYVLQSMSSSAEVQEEINGQVAELTRLHEKEPFPSDENIAAAKQEQVHVKELLTEVKGYFVPIAPFPATDNHGFQELLGTTILDLQKQAASIGVSNPPQYAFTFSGQRNALQLSPSSIQPWLIQLAEIQAMTRILYHAKINELYSIRRVPVTDDDRRQANTVDYLPTAIVLTNQTAVFTPYELSFRGFSTEIASVLNDFLQSSNCFLVKSISIEPAPFVAPVAPVPGVQPAARYAPPAGLAPSEDRYGIGTKGGSLPAPAPAPAPTRQARPAAGPSSITVLSERPLRVTMLVETVRLRDRK